MPPTVRAVLYSRVSTGMQVAGASLDTQQAMAEAYAAERGWSFTHTYTDVMSGKTDARPEFQRMLSDAAKRPRPFDVVMFYRVDRFSRRATYWWSAAAILEDAGIDLHSLTQRISGRDGRIVLHALIMAAEIEGDAITSRMSDALRHRAATGTFTPSRVAFGYDYVPKTETEPASWAINPAEAAIVREAFAALPTASARQIAHRFNQEGKRTKSGALWASGNLLQILRNPVYYGVRAYGRRVRIRQGRHQVITSKPRETWLMQPNRAPAIIDEATWQAAQAILARRGTGLGRRTGGQARHPWGGLIVCGECGGPMHWVGSRSGFTGDVRRYYACTRTDNQGPTACARPARVSEIFLDEVAIPYLDGLLSGAHASKAVEARAIAPRRRAATPTDTFKAIETERQRWHTLYAKGRLTDEAHDAEMAALDARAAHLRSLEVPPSDLPGLPPAGLAYLWKLATPAERHVLALSVVRRIVVRHKGDGKRRTGQVEIQLQPADAPRWPWRKPVVLDIKRVRRVLPERGLDGSFVRKQAESE